MKTKLILSILIVMISKSVFAQSNDFSDSQQNNEVRLNFLMAIVGFPEINYEHYLNENMGVGMAVAFSIIRPEDMSARFLALPYCRVYFGEQKKAAGFFIEGNMALESQKEPTAYSYYNISTNFGFGAAVGFKLLTRSGVTGEVYLGAGRLFGNSIDGAYPRCGICIGKRF